MRNCNTLFNNNNIIIVILIIIIIVILITITEKCDRGARILKKVLEKESKSGVSRL